MSSLLDSSVIASSLSHVMSTLFDISIISVAELREMVQVRVREVIPAYRGPGGTVMLTLGVETGKHNIRLMKLQ